MDRQEAMVSLAPEKSPAAVLMALASQRELKPLGKAQMGLCREEPVDRALRRRHSQSLQNLPPICSPVARQWKLLSVPAV
jgi:hypothetical protein